ncbi:ABC transporter permease [Shouchella lonarensis]|uniref:ABC-2 type transport system permease protein n=1 Tax=Shouchella lonarensis TaxID=1464122 RepID=A0A1G6GJ00_9BACI|nr:ABC transporter permease subunit [Shouchella lonarensis]SDB81991.1 ABC-2 type transport system permease protein [Shouchella lonarensis]
MMGLWKNEWIKAWYGRKISIFLMVMAGLIVLGIGLSLLVDTSEDKMTAMEFSFQSTSLFTTLGILYGVILMTGAIASEFSTGTVKQLCIRPMSRFQVLIAKWTGNMVFSLAIIVFVYMITIIAGVIFFPLEGESMGHVFYDMGKQLLYYVPTLFFYIGLATMMAILTKNTAVTLVVTLLPFFFSTIVSILAATVDWSKWLFFTHIHVWNNYHPDGMQLAPFDSMWASITFLTLHALLFLFIAHVVFKRRDVV